MRALLATAAVLVAVGCGNQARVTPASPTPTVSIDPTEPHNLYDYVPQCFATEPAEPVYSIAESDYCD